MQNVMVCVVTSHMRLILHRVCYLKNQLVNDATELINKLYNQIIQKTLYTYQN